MCHPAKQQSIRCAPFNTTLHDSPVGLATTLGCVQTQRPMPGGPLAIASLSCARPLGRSDGFALAVLPPHSVRVLILIVSSPFASTSLHWPLMGAIANAIICAHTQSLCLIRFGPSLDKALCCQLEAPSIRVVAYRTFSFSLLEPKAPSAIPKCANKADR